MEVAETIESIRSLVKAARSEGKKIGLSDALRVFWCILRYWRWD